MNAALGPIGAMSSFIAADKLGILSSMRYAWQLVNSQWDQWIVGYNVDRQRQFFSQLGLGASIDWRTLGDLAGRRRPSSSAALIGVGLLMRDLPEARRGLARRLEALLREARRRRASRARRTRGRSTTWRAW